MSELTVSEVLTTARQVLERDGHAQHTYLATNGEHCAQGAILVALGCMDFDGRVCIPGTATGETARAVRAANIALAAHLPPAPLNGHQAARGLDSEWGDAVERIVAFNNAAGRTESEVLAVFDAAIAREEGR